jgi:hypothetical protein
MMNGEVGSMCEELVMARFEKMSRYLPGRAVVKIQSVGENIRSLHGDEPF